MTRDWSPNTSGPPKKSKISPNQATPAFFNLSKSMPSPESDRVDFVNAFVGPKTIAFTICSAWVTRSHWFIAW